MTVTALIGAFLSLMPAARPKTEREIDRSELLRLERDLHLLGRLLTAPGPLALGPQVQRLRLGDPGLARPDPADQLGRPPRSKPAARR